MLGKYWCIFALLYKRECCVLKKKPEIWAERQWEVRERNSSQSCGLNSGGLLCLRGIPECTAVFARYPRMLCISLHWQSILTLMAGFTRLAGCSLRTHKLNLAWNLYYVKESSERMIISPIHKYTHFRTYIIAVFVLKTRCILGVSTGHISQACLTLLSSVLWIC